MKTLILSLLLTLGSSVYAAAAIECATADGSSVVAYHADSMNMEFVMLRGVAGPAPIGSGQFVAIVGEPEQKNNKTESTANFEYKLANGQTVEILWAVGQFEILVDHTVQALGLKVFDANGELRGDYPNCRRL